MQKHQMLERQRRELFSISPPSRGTYPYLSLSLSFLRSKFRRSREREKEKEEGRIKGREKGRERKIEREREEVEREFLFLSRNGAINCFDKRSGRKGRRKRLARPIVSRMIDRIQSANNERERERNDIYIEGYIIGG